MAEVDRSMGARSFTLQLAASAGMELSWLYAVSSLLAELLGLPRFPLGLAAMLFAVAVAGTAITRVRGWRRYAVAAVHTGLLLPAALVARVALVPWVAPGHMLTDFNFVVPAASPEDPAVTPIVLLAACAAFWWSGFRLSRRSTSGDVVGTRFDFGIIALAVVVGIGWAAGSAGTAVRFLIPSFFLFGVLAVALARSHGTGTRSFPVGFGGAGVVSSFVLAGGILGLAVLMLLPLPGQAARAGYSVVRRAAVSTWPYLLAFLRWLLHLWTPRADEPVTGLDRGEERLAGRSALDFGSFDQIVYRAAVVILAAVLLFFAAILVWQLARWLGARSPREDRARHGNVRTRRLRRRCASSRSRG